MKGLAAILVELEKPLVLEEVEIPKLTFGQVLVKVLCSGICGSQLGEIEGVKGDDKYLPHLLGHEGHGEVLECGKGVRSVKPGDKVVLHWRKGIGIDSETPKYLSKNLGLINAGWVTTFNEYAVISENRLTVIPSHVKPDHAALMGCAVTTALGTLTNDGKSKIGESIAIFGCGGVGLSLIQFAKISGVMYLKLPKQMERKLDETSLKTGKDGQIAFTGMGDADPLQTTSLYNIQPEIGWFYIIVESWMELFRNCWKLYFKMV